MTHPPTGIAKFCVDCGAELLNPHEITGLCLECKLIGRIRLAADRAASNHTGREATNP